MNMPQIGNKDISKQQEYVKQQQQLRALGTVRNSSNSKTLSADSMIEDLMSKKETFQKRSQDIQQKQEGLTLTHPLYERVWQGVQTTGGLADTPLLSSLLMSSGLSTDTLGYIWSLANRTVPGALTQQELYLVLAMVGLAQTGYVVNNLAALHQLPQAPVPTLDLSLLPTRVPAPHIYPNPLSVTSLPEPPLNFNWVSETAYPSSSDKIDISYVSSGPMISPKLLTDQIQIMKMSNVNPIDFGSKNKRDVSNDLPVTLGLESKTNTHSKHSSNTFSFSFPSLNESPSHVAGTKPQEIDPFDDEFTDFQSANFNQSTASAPLQYQSNVPVNDEDEFMNFQKASPKYDSDDLSVLVVGGRNIPSAQQLWVTDSPSIGIRDDKFGRKDPGKGEVSESTSDSSVKINLPQVMNKISETKDHKYDVFQDISDKYSVFHNPLPEDEDQQSTKSGNAIESVPIETKSIFSHPLFDNPPPSLDLFSHNNQTPSLELPKFSTENHQAKDIPIDDDDDEEFSNFQTFPVDFSETANTGSDDKTDRYDVFRTIIFQDTTNEPDSLKIGEVTKDNFSNIQLFDAEMDTHNKGVHPKEERDPSVFTGPTDKQNADENSFGDFQKSADVPSNNKSNIDNLFSALEISEKDLGKEPNYSDQLTFKPAEDKYKALRLLETSVETDDFGEFLGAELPNARNEPPKNENQASIQIRCLEACLNLLKAGLSTLSGVSGPDVMNEVLSDPRANTYLDCLLEVHLVSERIISHMDSDSCAPLALELRRVWESLGPYFSHTEHNHLGETVGALCGVCRSNTGPCPVTFGALSFHSPCANLYLHCVEPSLPNISVTAVAQ